MLVFSQGVHAKSVDKVSYHNCEFPENQNKVYSLACGIYHEARGESLAGRLAVGFVIMNRKLSERFPDTITGVVYQRSQFSWTHDGLSDRVFDYHAWVDSLQLATIIIDIDRNEYKYKDITEGSLFYHATKVYPNWADKRNKTVQIDNHIFYLVDKKK